MALGKRYRSRRRFRRRIRRSRRRFQRRRYSRYKRYGRRRFRKKSKLSVLMKGLFPKLPVYDQVRFNSYCNTGMPKWVVLPVLRDYMRHYNNAIQLPNPSLTYDANVTVNTRTLSQADFLGRNVLVAKDIARYMIYNSDVVPAHVTIYLCRVREDSTNAQVPFDTNDTNLTASYRGTLGSATYFEELWYNDMSTDDNSNLFLKSKIDAGVAGTDYPAVLDAQLSLVSQRHDFRPVYSRTFAGRFKVVKTTKFVIPPAGVTTLKLKEKPLHLNLQKIFKDAGVAPDGAGNNLSSYPITYTNTGATSKSTWKRYPKGTKFILMKFHGAVGHVDGDTISGPGNKFATTMVHLHFQMHRYTKYVSDPVHYNKVWYRTGNQADLTNTAGFYHANTAVAADHQLVRPARGAVQVTATGTDKEHCPVGPQS